MALKRLTDLMVGVDTATTTTSGFLSVVDENQATLSGTPTIATTPVIYIKQALGSTTFRLSQPIHGKSVRNWSGRSAVAGILQASTVTTSVSFGASTNYSIYITINSDKELSQGNRRFQINYFTPDTAPLAATAWTALVASANANTGLLQYVTISGGTTSIVFTAKRPDIYFSIGRAEGFDSNMAIATTVGDPGLGTYDEILALEEICKGYEGYMGERRTFVGNLPGFSRPTYYTVGTAGAITGVYDLYIIDHDNPFDSQGNNDTEGKPLTTYIAVPATPSLFVQANFESVLNSYMASSPGAFAAVNL